MRYITSCIRNDLSRKMVFLGGPRQCGKTTLAQHLMQDFIDPIYFNWDDDLHRRAILQRRWPEDSQILVFDEIHKFKRWKSWLKGLYDTQKSKHQFLVTGSARLDVYRRGGDSLMGRYHYWRLHPFTLSELPNGVTVQEGFSRLMKLGGFPEPFLSNDEREARRWRKERIDRVIRDDVRDLEGVRDIRTLELLLDLLRTRVGGPVVVKNLADDLQVSQPTVKHWLEVLERMYLIFLVYPYSKNISRAIQKPPKVYFFDNADVGSDEGARFENLVATHLLKSLHFLEDRDGYRYQLRYLRDKEGREVDFVLLRENSICELIEAKWNDDKISKSLNYYVKKLRVKKATQLLGTAMNSYHQDSIRVTSAMEDLKVLERKSLLANATIKNF